MAGTLAKDIVSDVIVELSQVPGIATQLYASGRIMQHVQDAYLLEIDGDIWWPGYMCYVTSTLDGTTGRLAADLVGPISTIDSYEDIVSVWPAGSNRKLRELPQSLNPYTLQSGPQCQYMSPDNLVAARPFRVWPQSSTGDVVVLGQQHTALPFDNTTVVYVDRLLLTYDATWMYCVDDGTVPAQVQKFQMLAAKRRQQMIAILNQHPLELDNRYPTDVDATAGWFQVDVDPLA
jgi:hypothetical protein